MAKYALPASIRITSKVSYEVVYSDSIAPDFGECRPDTKQIVINPKQSKREAFLTLIHEVVHAMDNEHAIGITEAQTVGFEEAIFQVLKLNKLL